MRDLTIIYRCCELETGNKTKRPCRPVWFSKEKSLNNLINTFQGVQIKAVHDGEIGPLFRILSSHENIEIIKINKNSNHESLMTTLELGKSSGGENIYFVEDDYIHLPNSKEILMSGLNRFSLVTGYNHPDRYIRNDDLDFGQSYIFTDQFTFWRSAESTTCTWACKSSLYKDIADLAIRYGLEDREFFRELYRNNILLFNPMPGFSTHCHEPFISPFIDWKNCP